MGPDTVGDMRDVECVEVFTVTLGLYEHLLAQAVVIAPYEHRQLSHHLQHVHALTDKTNKSTNNSLRDIRISDVVNYRYR